MNGLDSLQAEQLKQIADYLSKYRQTQGVSLEKVANGTFIPLRLLQAMESDRFEQLPEPIYVKGFIRKYADFLGLDGQEFADAFPTEPAPLAQPTAELEVSPPAEPIQPRRSRRSPSSRAESGKGAYWPWILSGLGVLALGAIAISLLKPFKPASSPVATAPDLADKENSSSAPVATVPSPTISPLSSPSPEISPSPKAVKPDSPGTGTPTVTGTPISGPVQVEVNLTDRSWLEVVADGKTSFEGILKKGEQRTWKAQKKLVLRVGNAGAVVASFNQGEAKPLGKVGAVVDVVYPDKQGSASIKAQ